MKPILRPSGSSGRICASVAAVVAAPTMTPVSICGKKLKAYFIAKFMLRVLERGVA